LRQNQPPNNIFHNGPKNIFGVNPEPEARAEEKPVCPDAVKASKIKDEIEVVK
jgi:hypothetical protein